jgi:hypothetical protein
MMKRRSTWLAGSGSLLLILSLSGLVSGAEPPATAPAVTIDTTATFEDLNGDGIDDDCTAAVEVLDQAAVDVEVATVDTNADGVISTTEAAHSPRLGGKNCNHGGYVSWIAHQSQCTTAPVDETVDPADETDETDQTVVLAVTTPPDAEPDRVESCETGVAPAITAAKKDKVAAAAARAASKAERTLARETAKAERTAARTAAKAERTAAREAAKAERTAARDAAKAARAAAHAAKAKHHSH